MDLLAEKRSRSIIETFGYGWETGLERMICHDAPTGGCQIDVAIVTAAKRTE